MNLPPQPGPSTSTAVPIVPGLPPLPGFGPAPSSVPDVESSRPSSPFTAGVKPLSPAAAPRTAAAPRQSLLRRILRRLEDNRVEGHEVEMTTAERKRKRAEDEASYALLKTVLNAIFVTTGLILLLSVIVVIIYTTFGTYLISDGKASSETAGPDIDGLYTMKDWTLMDRTTTVRLLTKLPSRSRLLCVHIVVHGCCYYLYYFIEIFVCHCQYITCTSKIND